MPAGELRVTSLKFIMNGDQASEASQLDGLPEGDRKETQEIIDEITQDEKKGGDVEPGNDADKAAKAEAEAKAAAEAEAAKGKGDKKPDADQEEKPRRQVKLMPSYVHEIAQKKANERIAELETALAEAKAGKGNESAPEQKPDDAQKKALEDRIREVADKRNLDPETVKDLVELGMEFGGKLPAEVEQKLKAVDEWKATQEVQAEESAFNASFDKTIVPLIKAEYGEGVAADTIEKIREEMKGKAYSEEFKATPYSVIYKGIDDFRKFGRPKGSSERSRGGAHQAGVGDEGGGKLGEAEFANVTDADIEKMDGETFDKYSDWQAKHGKSQ